MPPISCHQARKLLQARLILIPHDGQEPTIWLFLIVMGGITGLAMVSVLIGCLAVKCCKRRRNRKLIQKKAAADIEWIEQVQSGSISTLADEEDDIIEQRTANLMAVAAFAGREQKLYAHQKKMKMSKSRKSSSIMMPITMAELKRWAVRSVTGCDGNHLKQQPAPNPVTPTMVASASFLPVPSQSTDHRDTSTDYQDPAKLVEELRSDRKRASGGKQRKVLG
ncbi:hypothetical protein A1O7_04957 [Cladophialophora yegresii CBS 114405]|uniref:Uncharacterized protein n=1 Tax=Cladophialophora yegresii CBS 114405 TaxID=1182544 RepID=W9WR03_9EURO|nr:uncharacterized protein A1O7_04957 [Cladophialophora yegresii CBS 114405]EXJ60804.1 hypothetical protein A1O7_04957 [Cladophialophora yegresii CBS 114405]